MNQQAGEQTNERTNESCACEILLPELSIDLCSKLASAHSARFLGRKTSEKGRTKVAQPQIN